MWQRCDAPRDLKRIGAAMANLFETKKAGQGMMRVLYQYAEALDVLYATPDQHEDDINQLTELDDNDDIMFEGCDNDSSSDVPTREEMEL